MQVLSISPKRRNKLVLGFVGVDNYTWNCNLVPSLEISNVTNNKIPGKVKENCSHTSNLF
jgi:hypothetical protein